MMLKQTFDEIGMEIDLLLALSEQLNQDCRFTVQNHEHLTDTEHDRMAQILQCTLDISHCLKLVQEKLQILD